MASPVQVKQSSAQLPLDEKLDAILEARQPKGPVAPPKSTGKGPVASVSDLSNGHSGAVAHSEELWSSDGQVSLTVRGVCTDCLAWFTCVAEHSNSVSFVGSNFSDKRSVLTAS